MVYVDGRVVRQSVIVNLYGMQDLLTRVENAVDKFLFWDEEVTIYEAVTSVRVSDSILFATDYGSDAFSVEPWW